MTLPRPERLIIAAAVALLVIGGGCAAVMDAFGRPPEPTATPIVVVFGATPTPTASVTPTATSTVEPMPTATPVATPTPTAASTPTSAALVQATPRPTTRPTTCEPGTNGKQATFAAAETTGLAGRLTWAGSAVPNIGVQAWVNGVHLTTARAAADGRFLLTDLPASDNVTLAIAAQGPYHALGGMTDQPRPALGWAGVTRSGWRTCAAGVTTIPDLQLFRHVPDVLSTLTFGPIQPQGVATWSAVPGATEYRVYAMNTGLPCQTDYNWTAKVAGTSLAFTLNPGAQNVRIQVMAFAGDQLIAYTLIC